MHNMSARDLPTLARLDALLAQLGAQLSGWQVHALYLGAQASTSFGLGPERLLDRIFGDDVVLGESLEEMNANLRVIVGYWNRLLVEKQERVLALSHVHISDPPTTAQLATLAERRADELKWFVRGVDAGGDDPIEFGPEGQEILRRLAEASAFFGKFHEAFGTGPEESREKREQTRASLEQLSEVVLSSMLALTGLSDAIRAEAVADLHAREGRETDDGAQVASSIKVGRNEPCPCGSGKKWKRCCGARVH